MSNLTLEERARYAPESFTHDELIDLMGELQGLRSYDPKPTIQEAICQYPNEDFLQSAIDQCRTISKLLRGDNRSNLVKLLEELETIQSETAAASEYGISELRSLIGKG